MNKTLYGVKVALLAANGFSQDDMIAAQKAMIAAGANMRIVSPENGLVNGWDGVTWGHHFAVDAPLGTALGADYSVLVIPGGQRSVEKLNLTAHTKRFISSFLDAGKPIIIMDNALHILMLTGQMKDRTVSGPAELHDVVLQAGGNWSDDEICRDGGLMTGAVTAENRAHFISEMIAHCGTYYEAVKAA